MLDVRPLGHWPHPQMVRGLAEHRARGDIAPHRQPLVIPGLLQTADYARALFRADTLNTGDEAVDHLVDARLTRQRIFDQPEPPNL
jgi:hypothetical protein